MSFDTWRLTAGSAARRIKTSARGPASLGSVRTPPKPPHPRRLFASQNCRRADFLVAGEDTQGYGCRRSPFEAGDGYIGDSTVVSMAQHEGTPAVEEGVRVLGSPRL